MTADLAGLLSSSPPKTPSSPSATKPSASTRRCSLAASRRHALTVSGVFCSQPCFFSELSRLSMGVIVALNYLIFHAAGGQRVLSTRDTGNRVSGCSRPCTYMYTTDPATTNVRGISVQKKRQPVTTHCEWPTRWRMSGVDAVPGRPQDGRGRRTRRHFLIVHATTTRSALSSICQTFSFNTANSPRASLVIGTAGDFFA